jgi:hypothetical protein
MTLHRLELEALDSTEELLRSYDPVTDQWRFSHDGSFWQAVEHAHDIGWRGQGGRIAIIDSGCKHKTVSAAGSSGFPYSTDTHSGDIRDGDAVSEREPCAPCTAASQAAESGKLVLSAVGNRLTDTYCPARAEGVVAVGFQQRERMKPAPDKDIEFLAPVFRQALQPNLMLLGVPGAIGSSFASPLYAGIGALGLTQSDLWGFIESYSERVGPLRLHAQVDTTGGIANAQPGLLEDIEQAYWQSFSSIPHSHCDVQSQRLPNLPRLDPKHCPFCGVFADLQYINFGWWLYERKRVTEAINVLEAARLLCPWSAKLVAFEGSAYYALGALDRAIQNYELAIQIRPGYRPYIDALSQLQLSRSIRPLAPELAAMSDLKRTLWRRSIVRKLNGTIMC